MKIVKKYVFAAFLKPFIAGLLSFLMIMMITHFFDYLHVFLEYKPSLSLLSEYFLQRIPEWIVTILPVATLLGILFSLGTLNRHHELTAIKSSGIKIIYALRALIFFSILLSIFSMVVYEGIVPRTNARAEELYDRIKNREPKTVSSVRRNFTYLGESRRLYFISFFEDSRIEGLKIIEFFPGTSREERLITAQKAFFKEGNWHLQNGTIRRFASDGNQSEYKDFTNYKADLPETPANFRKPEKQPEQMGLLELKSYIEKLEKGGFSTVKERVLFHHKIAFPFSNAIILILGIPMALWGGMKNRTTGFFFSLIVCFIYWGAISVGRALGTGGILPPALGAWAANIVFLLLSLAMMKASRII